MTSSPDLGFGRVIGNNVFEVVFECVFVSCGLGVRDALVEFNDDACETVFSDEDFLVVGDFPDVTVSGWLESMGR